MTHKYGMSDRCIGVLNSKVLTRFLKALPPASSVKVSGENIKVHRERKSTNLCLT